MSFRVSDTFHFNDRPGDNHVYIVISDPSAPEIVVVSFTTLASWKDQACIPQSGDHPAISHPTCIGYDYAEVVDTQLFEQKIQDGNVRIRGEPVTKDIMIRIWDGAEQTNRMTLRCRQILRDQGLIG